MNAYEKYSSGNGNVHCHFCIADNHTNDNNNIQIMVCKFFSSLVALHNT